MPITPSSATHFVPHAVVATLGVIVLPAVAVSFVGTRDSPWLVLASLLLAMVTSVAAASAGSAIWARRRGSRDVVFADLMLWGWLRRVRAERRLAEARGLLGADDSDQRCRILQQLAAELEAKDPYTLGHSRRVTRHSERIALELGLPDDEVARIRIAASVHDVGKVRTPKEVLRKPGHLSAQELEVVRRHVVDGADMVAELGDCAVTEMVRHHHERLDGSGYPDGLTGDDISLGARIIAVADTFDAMTSNRPYHSSYSHRRALEVLSEDGGSRLDHDAAAAFLRYYSGTRGVAWSAFGFAAQPRVAGWAGGALSGVGGWSAVPQSIAATLAAMIAGVGLGGAPTPATAASERSATRAPHGPARDGDRRESLARGPAAPSRASDGVLVLGGGVRQSERAPPGEQLDRPSEQPPPEAGNGHGPIAEPSPPVPPSEPPTLEPPATEPPATEPPAIEIPTIETPTVEILGLELPHAQVPGVELPEDAARTLQNIGL
jgi:hypothetical protein